MTEDKDVYIQSLKLVGRYRTNQSGMSFTIAVAQSVERATPGEQAVGTGSNPAVATGSLLVGSVSVFCDRLRQKSWSHHSVSCVTARKIVRRQSWNPSAI